MLFAYVAVLISTESPTGGSLQIFPSPSQTTLNTFSWLPPLFAYIFTIWIQPRLPLFGSLIGHDGWVLRERFGKAA
jgi:hypothetical protein